MNPLSSNNMKSILNTIALLLVSLSPVSYAALMVRTVDAPAVVRDWPEAKEVWTWQQLRKQWGKRWDYTTGSGCKEMYRIPSVKDEDARILVNGNFLCSQSSYVYLSPKGYTLADGNFWRVTRNVDADVLFRIMASKQGYHATKAEDDAKTKAYLESSDGPRVEKISENEYIFSGCMCAMTEKGQLSTHFRIITAYLRDNRMVTTAGCLDGTGPWILRGEVSEKAFREEQLAAYREVYDFAFGGKGAVDDNPKVVNDYQAIITRNRGETARWNLEAMTPLSQTAYMRERENHPEKFYSFGGYRDLNSIRATLGLPQFQLPGLDEGKFPNTNAGVATGKSVAKVLEKAARRKRSIILREEGGEHEYCADIEFGDVTVSYLIEHTWHREEAIHAMLNYATLVSQEGLKPEELAASLNPRRNLVGDFDLWKRPQLDDNGLPVKGSENSFVTFMRGNSVVTLWLSEYGNEVYDLRPLARAIDKLLVEGMRKAGEPLTREQDYLKEEKKQK